MTAMGGKRTFGKAPDQGTSRGLLGSPSERGRLSLKPQVNPYGCITFNVIRHLPDFAMLFSLPGIS